MEERMAVLVADAEVNRAHLESSAGILGQQQQLEEAARKQVPAIQCLHCFHAPPCNIFLLCIVDNIENRLAVHKTCQFLAQQVTFQI